MPSVLQAKMKLPVEFIQNLYKNFNEKTADKILLGMQEERFVTLRVNTIKSNIEEIKSLLDRNNIQYDEVEFYKDALIIKGKKEKNIINLDIYKNGLIYLQSLSSMIPALVLEPRRGENILDLTAAPGSKTTQMGAMMENEGHIVANEIDKIRCERLKHNIEMQGIKIAEVINRDGIEIGNDYKEKFDKVLLDTPCSGEGRFLVNDPKTYNSWSNKLVENLSNLQKKLFESAYNSLKKGGTIVYSTCTLNKEENERIINWAIDKFELEVQEININLKEGIKVTTKGEASALKILPSKRIEGFFVCKLKKK